MKPLLAVVVSDIHCGSDVGLAPPATTTHKGNIIGFGDNHHQAWLWDCWRDGISWAKGIIGKHQAALIVNGDATEGVHHRNEKDLLLADIERHVGMAVECLSPFARMCQKTFVVRGTECHTLNMENLLAKDLRAETGMAQDKWLINFNDGFIVDAAHHMPTTGRKHLEATAMSIMLANAQGNYLRSGHQIPRGYLRGHRHCGGKYDDGHSFFAVTGGWQFLTRHGFKVVTDSIPRPSLLILDWRGKAKGELPQIHQRTYNPEQDEIATA